jgi:hypothetical protein
LKHRAKPSLRRLIEAGILEQRRAVDLSGNVRPVVDVDEYFTVRFSVYAVEETSPFSSVHVLTEPLGSDFKDRVFLVLFPDPDFVPR